MERSTTPPPPLPQTPSIGPIPDNWSVESERTAVPRTRRPAGSGARRVPSYDEIRPAPLDQPPLAPEPGVICGPLLNFKHLSGEGANRDWHGSVLLVLPRETPQPTLEVDFVDIIGHSPEPSSSEDLRTPDWHATRVFQGEELYHDGTKAFWRFPIKLHVMRFESRWQYRVPTLVAPRLFCLPSRFQSMRIMFHSCNGFSIGTDMKVWKGGSLWHDVLRMHRSRPFHVMIGGGDQIYNDNVRTDGPLQAWTNIGNPLTRRSHHFDENLRRECDDFYYNNYVRWFNTQPFRNANCSIPQLNIWDDHDIIDGFGSYTDGFMRCNVFRGIGSVAHKYYLLFQHHMAPSRRTLTTESPSTERGKAPAQPNAEWTLRETADDPSHIIGNNPGPYIEERSRSIFCKLGARISFLGIDARTERTRHRINYEDTYRLIFERLTYEHSRDRDLKHLIVLLGVPIAYPRLQWLENFFDSPLIAPIRFLNRRFGFAGGLFNKFDGQVDLLDDLDDHYTTKHHKAERSDLIRRLQDFSREHSVRVTILSGDVHLAAIGRFYSRPEERIAAERDWRYMVNVISSAITNKPPPGAVANLIARRDKVHHVDGSTDERMLDFFDRNPGRTAVAVERHRAKPSMFKLPGRKTAARNHITMPSRNYAILCESGPPTGRPSSGERGAESTQGISTAGSTATAATQEPSPFLDKGSNTREPMHEGERRCGTQHPAADSVTPTGLGGPYGLDVTLRVEIDSRDITGTTEGYGLTIPGLECQPYVGQGRKW